MSPKNRSIVGLVSIALIAVACSTAGPTNRPSVPSPSSSNAASASTPAASPSIDPSSSFVAGETVASESPSAEPTPVDREPSGEPTTDTVGHGCGTGQAGLFAHLDEVPKTLQFGHATLEYTNISVSMRNGTYDASDSVPGGIGLTPDEIAVVVGPSDHIVLRAVGLTLTATQARVVPWSTVDFSGGLPFSRADPGDLPWRVRTDGSLSISAPRWVGDYEVEFDPAWRGTCVAGGGVAYSRIKVNG